MSGNYHTLKNAKLRRMLAERAIDLDLDNAPRGQMINALKAWDNGDSNPELAEASKQSEGEASQEEREDPMKGKMRIVIPNTEGEASSNTVFVGCNGHSWYIPKDREVVLPKLAKSALDLAVETITDMPEGQKRERRAKRVPYQILEEGPD